MDKNKLYRNYLEEQNPGFHISECTANDLNMDDVTSYLDCTVSMPGKQMWYSRLRAQAYGAYDKEKRDEIARLTEDDAYRDATEKVFRSLASEDAAGLVNLFAKDLPMKSRRFLQLIVALQLAMCTCLVISFCGFAAWGVGIGMMLVILHLILHYRNKLELAMYDFALTQIVNLIKCSKALRRLDSAHSYLHSAVIEAENELNFVRSSLKWFKPVKTTVSDMAIIAWAIGELFKIITLIEVYSYSRTLNRLQGRRQYLREIYEFVGGKDVLRSIACLRSSLPVWTEPDFSTDSRCLSFTDIYHPLIDDCVTNSLAIASSSVLLTGSNMSGKSTFIRCVGVNVLLAQNMLTCFAKTFSLSFPLRVSSMIHVQDDLNESKSLFFSEVMAVKGMLEQVQSGNGYLFLLDEMFRGTNTIERIAGAAAVLDFLSKDNLVFAATHDLELTQTVDKTFRTFHFCEQVKAEQIVFDYRLHEGVLKEFNALKILKINQFPDEVMAGAYRRIDELAAGMKHGQFLSSLS